MWSSRFATFSMSAMSTSDFTNFPAVLRSDTSTSARFLASSARSSRGSNALSARLICGSSRDVVKMRSHDGSLESSFAITPRRRGWSALGISSSASMMMRRGFPSAGGASSRSGAASSASKTSFGSVDSRMFAGTSPSAAAKPGSRVQSIAARLRSSAHGLDCSASSWRQKCHATTK